MDRIISSFDINFIRKTDSVEDLDMITRLLDRGLLHDTRYRHAVGIISEGYKDIYYKLDEATIQEQLSFLIYRQVHQRRNELLRKKIDEIAKSFVGTVRSDVGNTRVGWDKLMKFYEVWPKINEPLQRQFNQYKDKVMSNNSELGNRDLIEKDWLYLAQVMSPNSEVRVGERDLKGSKPKQHWCGVFATYVLREAGRACGCGWKDVQWGRGAEGGPFLHGKKLKPIGITPNNLPKIGDIVVIRNIIHHCIVVDVEGNLGMNFATVNGNSDNQGITLKGRNFKVLADYVKEWENRPKKLEDDKKPKWGDYYYDATSVDVVNW